MVDIEIKNETYGLFLITSNVCDYLIENDDSNGMLIENLIIRIKKEIKDVRYINSWTLLGIHDLAILVKSKSKLDRAITVIGESLNELKDKIVKPPALFQKNEEILRIFKRLIEDSPQKIKKIEIFDFWCEPLIPLYINDKSIERKDNNCIIVYYRLNTKKLRYDDLVTKITENCINISEGEVCAIFNGFGIFDLVLFIKFNSYLKIPQIINDINLDLKDCLRESCSLICAPFDGENDEIESIPFSIIMKTTPCQEKSSTWKDIEYLAEKIGITRICIEKINKPMSLTYKQGFFDTVFIGHGTLNQFSNLCRILESLPFIIDTSTMLNLDYNLKIKSTHNAISTISTCN